MLPSIVTVVSPTEAYIQKAKPAPIGQADIDTLCARLNVEPQGVVGSILDDVIEDEGGALHPARRLTVRLAKASAEPGAVVIRSSKRKRGRPPKADAGGA
jgi:hypothetical protein